MPDSLSLEALAGKWYIHLTDFPMWLKGDKLRPTFNYSPGEKCGKLGLEDVVRYEEKGKIKTIKGFDYPQNESNTAFKWRGKGLLFIAVSKWEILWMSDDQEMAIIHFQKTLFTPEGYDVMARTDTLSHEQSTIIQQKIKDLGIVSELVPPAGK